MKIPFSHSLSVSFHSIFVLFSARICCARARLFAYKKKQSEPWKFIRWRRIISVINMRTSSNKNFHAINNRNKKAGVEGKQWMKLREMLKILDWIPVADDGSTSKVIHDHDPWEQNSMILLAICWSYRRQHQIARSYRHWCNGTVYRFLWLVMLAVEKT